MDARTTQVERVAATYAAAKVPARGPQPDGIFTGIASWMRGFTNRGRDGAELLHEPPVDPLAAPPMYDAGGSNNATG